VLLMATLSCGGSDSTTPQPTPNTTIPAAVLATSTTTQSGVAGQQAAIRPSVSVTAAAGNPLASVPVTFSVTVGGGSLSGGSTTTNSSGVATVGSWTLGPAAGVNTMTATVAGLTPVTFTVTTTAPTVTPAAVAANSATSQAGSVGQPVAERPSVKVTSSAGAAVAAVAVTFAITGGGGSLTGASTTTDANGVATVGSWTLGPVAGANTMTATVSGLPPVSFTATSGPLPSFTLTPSVAAAVPLGSVSLAASDAVTWNVNGLAGGSSTVGTISATGVYTAPNKIPDGDSVVVTATLASNTAVQRTATIFFVPDVVTKDYYVPIPRVVDATSPARTRILLVPPANATSVSFLPNSGAAVPLQSIGAGVMTFTVEAGPAVAGYVTGALHNVIGRLDYRDASNTQVKNTSLSLNVRDATMPAVTVTSVATDAQRSPYILNLRVDTITVHPNAQIASRALQLLGGDLFDFLAVIATVTTNNNRVYIGLRNDITGIGSTVFNNSAAYGGTGKIRGMMSFPIDGLFDGAEQGFMHEMGHSWINYASDPLLQPGPHWPLSTMAHGTMGFNIAGSNVGGNFPFTLTSLGNGTVRVNTAAQTDIFTPLDLYIMGLVPSTDVPPMFILPAATNPQSLVDNQVLSATTYTISNYLTAHGPRVPSNATSPKQFTVATVVLSYGRLLTASEMAFFDRAAARAETLVPLQSQTGLVLSTASGFNVATGGRATVKTRLQ
jgi:hypothetical protein